MVPRTFQGLHPWRSTRARTLVLDTSFSGLNFIVNLILLVCQSGSSLHMECDTPQRSPVVGNGTAGRRVSLLLPQPQPMLRHFMLVLCLISRKRVMSSLR